MHQGKDGCTMHHLFITHTKERETHTHTQERDTHTRETHTHRHTHRERDREGGENQTREHREQRCYKNRDRGGETEKDGLASQWMGLYLKS